MSLARVQKQLMKDLKRSPLKAGVLGLLCVVALWFWAPLVAGWFGKGGSKGKTAKPQAATVAAVDPDEDAPTAATPTGGEATPAKVVASVPWQKLVGWIENDPRKQSAQLGVLESPPFPPQQTDSIEEESKSSQAAAAKLSEVDVAQLGLKLSSTMLGPRRRVAVINGRPYAEGGEVEVGKEMVFLVARVTDRSVLLERNGRQFELVMTKDKARASE